MNTKVKSKIIDLAKANPGEEICGLMYQTFDSVDIYICSNAAVDRINEFEIDNQDYLACLHFGRPCGIYHSHPSGAAFSQADLDISDEMALPIYLYAVQQDEWLDYIPKTYVLPLEELSFTWGEQDCFSLIRTFYRQQYSIYIGDYDRDENFEHSGDNRILENFTKEGFIDTNSTCLLQKHDVLLFHTNMALPQHFGIFMGNSRFLHHPSGALSRIELLTPNWTRRLEKVLRYKNAL